MKILAPPQLAPLCTPEKSHTQGMFRGDHLFIAANKSKQRDKLQQKLSAPQSRHITAVGSQRTISVSLSTTSSITT